MIPFTEIPPLWIGPVMIPWWGTMQVLAVGIATYVAYKEAIRLKLDSKHIVNILLIMFGFGLLGMRLYHFAAVREYGFSFQTLSSAFTFSGGLDSAGGILGMIAVAVYLLIVNRSNTKFDWKKYLDVFALPMAILITFSRCGCAGILDELGKITSLPWAVFYNDALRHPVSWYYFLFGIVLFIIVYYLRKYPFKSGMIFTTTIATYFWWRFLIDFTRAYPEAVMYNMSVHQMVYGSAAIISSGILLCTWYKYGTLLESKKRRKKS